MGNMGFPIWDQIKPKYLVIKDFFKAVRKALPDAKISAYLFGQTTVDFYDMGIGQIIEDSFSYFDYVSPMLYPSHYANGFAGYENPALYPYDIVKYYMDSAYRRQKMYKDNVSKLRPWLQDFSLRVEYTEEMVKEQIEAVKEVLGKDYNGYMLWNPSNIYVSINKD